MVEIAVSPNLFSVGNFSLAWHGLFSFVAVATAVFLVGRWAPTRGVQKDDVYSIAIWAIIGGIIGARLVFVIDFWGELFKDAPLEIFAVWNGGIGVWGGILGGFLGGTVYSLIAKHPVGIIADLTAPALLIVQSIGRLGDIVNGEHCSKAADFFLGFQWTATDTAALRCDSGHLNFGLDGEVLAGGTFVHPAVGYEIAWNMIALLIVWKLRGRLVPNGMLFALYLALYSVGRFAIGFARIEENVYAGGLQEAQYTALIVLAITLPLLAIKARFTKRVAVDVPAPVERGTRAERRRRRRHRA